MKKIILLNNRLERCCGIAMMEILVAVVVLLVGTLGLLGLQAQGLKNNHSAYLKSQVVGLIDDMADRMRANKTGLDKNLYADITTVTQHDDPPSPTDPGYDCMTDYSGTDNGTSCDDENIANYDIYAWGKTLGAMLPSGYGTVVCNDSPCAMGSTHTITVLWDDHRTGNADTEFSVVFAL